LPPGPPNLFSWTPDFKPFRRIATAIEDAAGPCLNRRMRRLSRLTVALAVAAVAAPPAATARTALPSPEGPHVAAIRALAPGGWMSLGRPAADPDHGRARGRTWTASMPFAASLGGAFLFGEGIHGWRDPTTGRYMDGLWLYDANAHRWLALHPGTDTRNPPDLRLNADGFEALPDGSPIPVATMVHGYEMTAWDPVRQLFLSMPNHHEYLAALPSVAAFRQANRARLNTGQASPWIFDPWNRRWHRLRTLRPSPPSGFGGVLRFLPSRNRLFFFYQGRASHYDPSANSWIDANPGGPPPPFGIDSTACHDAKRDRVYVGGGSYPVAPGPNALWFYDVAANRWVDPAPAGSPGGNNFGTNVALMLCDAAADRVLVVRHAGPDRGVHAYDPARNRWTRAPVPLPAAWRTGKFANGFYHPGLGVHVFHVAGDSVDDGTIFVYRHAPE
jgi:hypothetical protein